MVHFVLCSIDRDLCQEWKRALDEYLEPEDRKHFTIAHQQLQSVSSLFDCIVSPANSYAKLDGAFDLAISQMFAPDNVESVVQYAQHFLYSVYNGFQPTGTALLIPMHSFPTKNKHNCRYIMHCPTMRTPSNCRWNKEVVYNCMWDMLCKLSIHNAQSTDKIQTVLVPGLGTGIGRFPAETCASQMVLAWKHFKRNLEKVRSGNTLTEWREITNDAMDIEETYRTIAFLG